MHGRVLRDVDDAHGERDLVVRRALERALAVPAFDDVREQARERWWQADALREHLGDLACGVQMWPQRAGRPRGPARDLEHGAWGRAPGGRQSAKDAEQARRLRAEHDREVMPGHAAAEDLGTELRISRATRMEEQARVVRLPARLLVDPEPSAEPGGEQRALQPMLERQSHPEVGRQAERADHLGGPYAFSLRRSVRHSRDRTPAGGCAATRPPPAAPAACGRDEGGPASAPESARCCRSAWRAAGSPRRR